MTTDRFGLRRSVVERDCWAIPPSCDTSCSALPSAGGSRVAYGAVLAAALCCYAALGAGLSILPRYVPDQLGGGPTAVGLAVGAPALTGLLARAIGGGLPDRLGGRRTVVLFAGCEAVGLLVFALASSAAAGMAALIVLSIGQSLAVPGLGLLALTRVPSAQQGAAAGLFFAWFDAGVGLGGPAVGTVASLTSPPDALIAAALAVATAAVLAITTASAVRQATTSGLPER